MFLHVRETLLVALATAALSVADSTAVKRFSRPPSAAVDEVNITSLLPASYTVMGPNVKASGSYHRASSRTGLPAQTEDDQDYSLRSIFKVHRSTSEDKEESLPSQPDISSVIPSTSTTTSGTTTHSPSSRIKELRQKFPRFRSHFRARLKNASPPDSTEPERSENLPQKSLNRENYPVPSKSKIDLNEPWIIDRPQRVRERTHYRTISSPNPQAVHEHRSTPSPSLAEADDGDAGKKNNRRKFDQILKRTRAPQMQQDDRQIERSSNHMPNSGNDFDENLYITRERTNPEWSSQPKESSVVQATRSELNKATKSDFRYPKVEATPTLNPDAPLRLNSDFTSVAPVKPSRAYTSVATLKPSRTFSSGDPVHPRRSFTPVASFEPSRSFTPSASVEPSQDFTPVSSVEPSRAFTPVASVKPNRVFTSVTASDASRAHSSNGNRAEDEREQHDSDSNFPSEIKRFHAAANSEQEQVTYAKSRNEGETGFPPVYSSNKNRENKWPPKSSDYRRLTSSGNFSRPTTSVPWAPDIYDSSITHKDSSDELFRDDVRKFNADPTKHLQYPRAQHTFHRHFYSDYEEDEGTLSSTDQEKSRQKTLSDIPDWAFDPKWLSPHEMFQPHSPAVTTTEKIIARPTIVPGALDVVRRSEFPFEFWRPDNVNFEEDAGHGRSDKNENAPPLNFREVPEHLFTVGNGPVAVPEELAWKSFEMVTAAPSFDLMSNPFQDDNFGRFNPPSRGESIGEPNFDVPQFEWTSDLGEFETDTKKNNFGNQSPQVFEHTAAPLLGRPPHNRDVFSGNAAIQKSPINVIQTGIPHLQTTSIPYGPFSGVGPDSRPLHDLGINEVPHVGTRTSPNKPFIPRGTNQHFVPHGPHRPKPNFPRHPEKLPSLRPPGVIPQNAVHLHLRHSGARAPNPGVQNRPFVNRPQRPPRGNIFPHRPQNANHFSGDPQFSGTSHFQAVNPHSKHSTVSPEYMTRSHFEVKEHLPQTDRSNQIKSPKKESIGHSLPPLNNNNIIFGADPRDEQSLQPYIPPNHFVPQQLHPNHFVPQQIFVNEKKKHKPPRAPLKHRRPAGPKKLHDYQSSSIWSALTNFDLNYFNPFGYDSDTPIERVATAAALPASVLVPGGLAVLGAGLSLFYFNFVWHPTPVVKARLINVLQNWSHSSVLTVEQQQVIGDVTKVYSALSDLAAKVGAMEDSLNSTANVTNHEALVSQPCKNKMVCQTYSEFQDLFEMTKSAATLLGSTLDHLDQEMLLEFLLAADRGHHSSAKAGNLTCDDFYPTCPLPPISVRETLRDLVGITPVVGDNSIDVPQDALTSSAGNNTSLPIASDNATMVTEAEVKESR